MFLTASRSRRISCQCQDGGGASCRTMLPSRSSTCWRWPAGWRWSSPGWTPRWAERIAGLAVPVLLSIAYTGLVLAFWSRAPGGFGSLPDVMALFTMPEIALAGWIHYLAFDLLVGAWEVRTARREGIAFLLVLPCLALTFLFGPAGFLALQRAQGRPAGAARRGRGGGAMSGAAMAGRVPRRRAAGRALRGAGPDGGGAGLPADDPADAGGDAGRRPAAPRDRHLAEAASSSRWRWRSSA